MISGEVKRKAIFYRALKILEAHIAEPLEDHPAMSRFDRLQDMRAAIDGAEKAYRQIMHDDHRFRPDRFFEASGFADLKLRKLRAWWMETATSDEAIVEVRQRHREYLDIIHHYIGPAENLSRWIALRDQCAEIIKQWDEGRIK